MRSFLLFLPALAVACAAPAEPPGTVVALADPVCRAEAEDSPGARAAAGAIDPVTNRPTPRAEAERLEAVARAYADCMRRRGLPASGGVERLRR